MAKKQILADFPKSWDDLLAVLAYRETGTKFGVCEILGIDVKTFAAKLKRLEKEHGPIVNPASKLLTPTGHQLADAAEKMRQVLATSGLVKRSREIHFAALDGLGSLTLGPRIEELIKVNPEMVVYFDTADKCPNLAAGEADIYLGTDHPADMSNATSELIGHTGAIWYVSKNYIEKHGKPERIEDFRNHTCIAPKNQRFQDAEEIWRQCYGGAEPPKFSMLVKSMDAYFRMVQTGVGMVLLPSYACLVFPDIVDVAAFPVMFPLILSIRKDLSSRPEIKKMVRFLKRVFDPEIYPWFGKDPISTADIYKRAAEIGYKIQRP